MKFVFLGDMGAWTSTIKIRSTHSSCFISLNIILGLFLSLTFFHLVTVVLPGNVYTSIEGLPYCLPVLKTVGFSPARAVFVSFSYSHGKVPRGPCSPLLVSVF